MRKARFYAAVLSLAVIAAGCGTTEIATEEESLTPDATLAQDVSDDKDTGGAVKDTGGSSDQCVNKYDCLKDSKLKGLGPCTNPVCDNGVCKVESKAAGTKCVDETLTLSACQESTCDANAECKAVARPDGAACTDANLALDECQIAKCSAGQCAASNKPDGNVCGIGSCKQCKGGSCKQTTPKDVDDGNPCTNDYCDPNSGERHDKITDLAGKCDDGDDCTGDGNCVNGTCKAQPKDCDDAVPCTTDSCVKGKGCVHKADNDQCSDDDDCLTIACDLSAGCTTTKVNVGDTCEDGDKECTKDDKCDKEGKCVGKAVCGCKTDKDCLGKDGKQKDLCAPKLCKIGTDGKGLCQTDPAQEVKCTDDGSNQCSEQVCDPKTGKCGAQGKNDGKSCDDGDKCTEKETCKKGACEGAKKGCDDKNPCTADSCAADTGCKYDPAPGKCDDGDKCTDKDECSGGGCKGKLKDCSDGVPCTKDTCSKESGTCTSKVDAKQCDDGQVCTKDSCDTKGAKKCVNKPDDSAKCDDGDKCTIDACKSGKCVATGFNKDLSGCGCTKDAECNDKNECTQDKCDKGNCVFDGKPMEAKACETGNKCHVAKSGVCKAKACTGGKAKDCSKSSGKCNTAVCNPKTGSCDKLPKKDGTTCNADGSFCTVGDVCAKGTCVKGKTKDCGDGDQCNDATCSPDNGKCGKKPKKEGTACEDNDSCTANDTCAKGKCAAGKPIDCSKKADQCNDGLCTKGIGCVRVAKKGTVKCNDGKFCTKTDVCKIEEDDGLKVGKCEGSGVPNCKATGQCQVAYCDAGSNKCATKAAGIGAPCDDGNKCTLIDACISGGKCQGTSPKKCSGDQCNSGVCNKSTGACGLSPLKDGTKCTDGSLCTQTDTCKTGKCLGGNPKKCAGDQCQDPLCDPKTGACHKEPKKDGIACTDGQTCTTGDKCKSGTCAPGTWTCGCKSNADCDDGNGCTTNTCVKGSDGKLSCKKVVKTGTSCDDKNKCTTSDKCQSSEKCVGSAKNCNDNNACTLDTCSTSTGACTYKTLTGAKCSDGNACTQYDACTPAKTCIGKSILCNDGNICTSDSCNKSTGKCQYLANTASCSDNNACTVGDKCYNKACKAGPAKKCDDGTICTTNSCNTSTGACSYAADTKKNNYTCEKGSYSRCNNGTCSCTNWSARVGVTTTSSYYENLRDVQRSGDYWYGVGYRRLYSGGKYYYYGFMSKNDKWGKSIYGRTVSYGTTTSGRYLYGMARNTKDNRWVAVGHTYNGSTYGTDGWAVEFDDNGYVRRNVALRPGTEAYHQGKKTDYLRDVVEDKNGYYYAAGYSYSMANSYRYNAWIIKFQKYSTNSFKTIWSRGKISTSYYSAYNAIGYGSYYDRPLAVGWTATASYSNQGLVSAWTNAGTPYHREVGGTAKFAHTLTGISVYKSVYSAVGRWQKASSDYQGWVVYGSASSGSRYSEGYHGSTGSDELIDTQCPGSYCYAIGRYYNTTEKKNKLWTARYLYYKPTSVSSYYSTYPPYTSSFYKMGYASSSELGIAGSYSYDGTLTQTNYSGYKICK